MSTNQNKNDMEDMFNTFVQKINSPDGRTFFKSFLAGDYSTSTKIAAGITSSSQNGITSNKRASSTKYN